MLLNIYREERMTSRINEKGTRKMPNFAGISSPYEVLFSPRIIVDTGKDDTGVIRYCIKSELRDRLLGKDKKEMILSFVIPCYRSESTIIPVIDEIHRIMSQMKEVQYEIIAVNDCSPDSVLVVLTERTYLDRNLVVIDLAKNVGKQGAVMAGFHYARGDIIVCLDDDGQCPVDHLPELLAALTDEYDIAMAQYGVKEQSRFRNFGSRANALMFQKLLDKPQKLQLTNFYAIKRFVVKKMMEYKNPYPYLHGLMLRTTKRIVGVPMKERKRISGKSGYTLKKLISFWSDGLTGFSVKPLRVASLLGFICILLSFFLGVFLIVHKLWLEADFLGWIIIILVQFFSDGVILLAIGLIGEYMGRMYISNNAAPQFVIRAIIDNRMEEEENV